MRRSVPKIPSDFSEVDHERLLIQAFIVPSKRTRMIDLLSKPKRRSKILVKLPHFRDLNLRYSFKIPSSLQTSKGIHDLLKKKGAPELCYIISIDPQLDAKKKTLSEALDQIVGFSDGVLISCIPGRLGYYEGEDPGERYILERTE